MSKREILVEMLYRYREAQETLLSTGNGSAGNPKLMPKTWNISFRELERCLQVMSGERPKQARMLLARYVDATICRRKLTGKRDNPNRPPRWKDLPAHSEVRAYQQLPDRKHGNEWDCVVLSWRPWVQPLAVEHGLDWLEKTFDGEPYLPQEMFELENVA